VWAGWRSRAWPTAGAETVYNLQIEDDHTYFVGAPDWGFL
jgi:hypothetical protein